jgi:hypothetical protein
VVRRPRPASTPRAPRRAGSGRPRTAHAAAGRDGLHALLRVVDHGLLDRLIRGRLWIGLIGFALIGIVAMQLVVLRLNTDIGKGLEHKANLQREISALQVASSALSAGERIQAEAARRGMQAVPPGGIQFLTARPADTASAAQLLASGAPGSNGTTGEASARHSTSSAEARPSHEGQASSEAESTGEGQSGAPNPSEEAHTTPAPGASGEESPASANPEGPTSEQPASSAAGQEAPHG